MSSSVSTATLSQPQQTVAGTKTATAPQQQQAQESKSSNKKQHDEFFWTYTEEPHATRRQAIIKAHPEVHIT
jgi:sphingolipid delta-4 desaturase